MSEKDLDSSGEFTIEGSELKSWNNDTTFKLNALYFKVKKACKVEIQLWGDANSTQGIMDLLLWPNAYPEIKPTLFKIVYNDGVQRPAIFGIYLNPYFQGLGEGKIEPRVYYGSNVSKVVVKRLIVFKEDNWCKYSLFLVRRAKDMLDLAREKYNGQVYDFCVHFSRFCTELSIKSIFSIFKKRFPHEHDVGRRFPYEIRTGIQKASPQVATMLPRLLWISQQLIGPERFDLYGDPDSLTPPDLIVTADEAKTALENAELCYRQCCILFEKVMSL